MQPKPYIRINPILGRRPNIGPIPGDLILPWGCIVVVNLFVFQMLFSSWELFVLSCLSSGLWHWLISGKQPWKFWGYGRGSDQGDFG